MYATADGLDGPWQLLQARTVSLIFGGLMSVRRVEVFRSGDFCLGPARDLQKCVE